MTTEQKSREYKLTLVCMQSGRQVNIDIVLQPGALWPAELGDACTQLQKYATVPLDDFSERDLVRLAYQALLDTEAREQKAMEVTK